jgi:hypothetical protein
MHLLQAGVDLTVIALWLGHESTATTHMYVEADLAMKERALNALQPPSVKAQRFRPTEVFSRSSKDFRSKLCTVDGELPTRQTPAALPVIP